MSLVRTAFFYAALFAIGGVTGVACFGGDDFGNPAFRCVPKDGADACPSGYTCCSDDPAAQSGKLPAFRGAAVNDTFGVAIFAEDNNSLSTQGMCVDTSEVANGLTNGCAVPCNPTWSADEISTICSGALCCQTQELDPEKDCILGADNRWRAVSGADIIAGATGWGRNHSTNQDPDAQGCALFVMASEGEAYLDCLAQLSVANQRGFCNAACPCVEDVCELKNPDGVPKCI